MKLRTILAITTLLTIYSCTSRTSGTTTTLTNRKLTGTIKQGKFTNDYLTMTVVDGWTELEGNDTTQFCIIQKAKDNFKPNIILLALDKRHYRDNYGFQTAEQYMSSLTDNFKSKPDYKLISSMDKVEVDSHAFYKSEFLLLKGDRKYRQCYYATDIDDYYLGIVTTADNDDLEPEIERTVQSIKFR